MAANKRQLHQLQEKLLQRLATCQGVLVDDIDLIGVLQETKNTVKAVTHQLTIAKETELEIEHAREEYRPVASRGSLLYFLLNDLARVNYMYQNGLPQFVKLFDHALGLAEKTSITHRRIANIIQTLTNHVWCRTMRSLFKRDRMMFTLMLAIRIGYQAGSITQEEVGLFIRAGAAYSLSDCIPKPAKWIPDAVWMNLNALSKHPVFERILTHVSLYFKNTVWGSLIS